MRLYSWNVNGVRAIHKKGFLDWLTREQPDVLCIQETKAHAEDVSDALREPDGYSSVWHSAEKKGYSGVACYFRRDCEPRDVRTIGLHEFDREGRAQILEYDDFFLVNAYYPNSQPERRRLKYKLDFCAALETFCMEKRQMGRNVVICGDFNISHKDIDLARPKANRNNPGFYPEECAAMDAFIEGGHVDVFRHFHPDEPHHYTWWSYRSGARERNVGWRLDYHCVNEEFMPRVGAAAIHAKVMGSDHCPVSLALRN
jgi:exodeoxyribonuclease-3